MAKKFYEVLGVSETATPEEIRKAYYKLALKNHPDKVAEDKREEATELFKEINLAHEILSDENNRKAYDNGLIDDKGSKVFYQQNESPEPQQSDEPEQTYESQGAYESEPTYEAAEDYQSEATYEAEDADEPEETLASEQASESQETQQKDANQKLNETLKALRDKDLSNKEKARLISELSPKEVSEFIKLLDEKIENKEEYVDDLHSDKEFHQSARNLFNAIEQAPHVSSGSKSSGSFIMQLITSFIDWLFGKDKEPVYTAADNTEFNNHINDVFEERISESEEAIAHQEDKLADLESLRDDLQSNQNSENKNPVFGQMQPMGESNSIDSLMSDINQSQYQSTPNEAKSKEERATAYLEEAPKGP
ncbi:molecular chaperone DnaJ [Legionella moravica]|uniref:Molecular chaperone DnaJ n=1 Tax=Legionella moravica TaxID=39962 RepID=A0A378JWZ2_9GAMM|nr:J domain-containing protein [Legionella moravica]KTD37438.1 molecular chaperone DnaJ [Legionella moravica]STX63084.1 molecular chaperone DnaJ [Legionella moravica]